MRCLMCNAEMVFIGAVPADATLPGFEHHTFSCSACVKLSADCYSLAQNLPSAADGLRIHAPMQAPTNAPVDIY